MKSCTFVEFYRFTSTNAAAPDQGVYQPVCGSDGVAYLDGRWGVVRQNREAATIGHKRGFDGYRIASGTHTRPRYHTERVQMILPSNVNK